jgi:hypothetical protein
MMAASGDAYARERAAIRELVTIPHCPEIPTARQVDFLVDRSREALYGGAAGGGKSSALLMAALQFIDAPDYAAIIFRRRLTDLTLPGGLISRARAWIGTAARWSETDHSFTFPSGATLSFGYCDAEGDHLRYQGAEEKLAVDDVADAPLERAHRFLLGLAFGDLAVEVGAAG